MNIKIQKTEDAQLLARLNHDVQKLHHEIEPEIFKPFSLVDMTSFFENQLSDKNVSAYIAHVDEIPAGYVLLNQKHVEENQFKFSYSVLYIDQICVDGIYKGKGVGKLLVNFAKQFAIDHNIKRVEMNYWSKNTNSGAFFRSQGFKNFNERLFINVK